MKTNRLFSLLSICILLLSACHKKDAPPSLTADKSAINLGAAAGKEYLQITSNVEWSLSGLPTGVTATPSTGKGDARIELAYPANTAIEAVTATLAISATGVPTVNIAYKQMGSAPTIFADKSTITEDGAGKTEAVVITSNVPWKLTLPEGLDWIAVDKTAGAAGTTTITFTVIENRIGKERKATLSLGEALGTTSMLDLSFTQLQREVTITSWSNKGKGGAIILMEGKGFSPVKEENQVTINGVPATIDQATPDWLRVIVPAKAGSGNIVVNVNSKTSPSLAFTYDWVWRVTNYAGNGSTDVLNYPGSLVVDDNFNLYVAEWNSFKISKVEPNGAITLFAGDGQGYHNDVDPTKAKFASFTGMAIDKTGNIYVADHGNSAVRKIATTGEVTTRVKYPTDARPYALAPDDAGNIYVSLDDRNQIDLARADGTFSSTGIAYQPRGITVDRLGNLYMFNMLDFKVYKNTPAGGITYYTGAGFGKADGASGVARFAEVRSMVVDKDGVLYVCDHNNSAVRMIDTDGSVTTIAGKLGVAGDLNGVGDAARFSSPMSIVLDKEGNLYVADGINNKIKKLTKE